MKNRLFYALMLVATLSLVAGCRKDSFEGKQTGENGTTFLRFKNTSASNPLTALFFSPFTDNKTIKVLHLVRDAASNASLNSTVTVQVLNDDIAAYNAAKGTNLVAMPEAYYTIVPTSGIVKTSTGYTVTFGPGELVKELSVSLNGANLDPSKSYAFMYKLGSLTGEATVTNTVAQTTTVTTVGIKNAYDGVFKITDGYVQRYTNPTTMESPSTLSGTMVGNPDVTLTTINANTVEISNMKWSVVANGGTVSGLAGIDNLRLTVDPATNNVTMFALGNASLANIAGEVNSWDPATKTFTLNFAWNPTGSKRTITNFKIKYSKSR